MLEHFMRFFFVIVITLIMPHPFNVVNPGIVEAFQISTVDVRLRNLSITLGHPATEFSVLFPRSQGPASAY